MARSDRRTWLDLSAIDPGQEYNSDPHQEYICSDPDQEYKIFVRSETVPLRYGVGYASFACYIPSDESSIPFTDESSTPFYCTSNGYKSVEQFQEVLKVQFPRSQRSLVFEISAFIYKQVDRRTWLGRQTDRRTRHQRSYGQTEGLD